MQEIQTDKMCESCKINKAKYTTKKGKLWCENNVSKCPAIKSNIGKINKEILSKVNDETGLSKSKELALKIKENAIINNFEDPYKVAAIKMVDTRKNKNSYSSATIKANETKKLKDENGLSINDKSKEKMIKTRNKIMDNGLTNYQNSAIKSRDTRLNDIDEKGRNGFDRLWIKGLQAKNYDGTNLYYRSNLEKNFLDRLVTQYNIDWVNTNVKNSLSIDYFYDKKDRKYLPDYVIGNKLYEIKSSYTFDNFGKDLYKRNKNIAKLDSALNLYEVYFILDDIEYLWKDIKKNGYII